MQHLKFIGGPREGEVLELMSAPPVYFFAVMGPPYVRGPDGRSYGTTLDKKDVYERTGWSQDQAYVLYQYQGREPL